MVFGKKQAAFLPDIGGCCSVQHPTVSSGIHHCVSPELSVGSIAQTCCKLIFQGPERPSGSCDHKFSCWTTVTEFHVRCLGRTSWDSWCPLAEIFDSLRETIERAELSTDQQHETERRYQDTVVHAVLAQRARQPIQKHSNSNFEHCLYFWVVFALLLRGARHTVATHNFKLVTVQA